MKKRRNVKRVLSAVLCMLMLLTAVPFATVTANAVVTAIIKEADTEVYVGDMFNIVAAVNGADSGETFTYQWQARYLDREWLNLNDHSDNNKSEYYGVYTNHLQMKIIRKASGWEDVSYRCKIKSSTGDTYYTSYCGFPTVLEKTDVSVIAFFDMDAPQQNKLPPTTATAGNSKYYTFDRIEWYQMNDNTAVKLADGEKITHGIYRCQLYFNMQRGYKVADDAVCGLYNGDYDDKLLKDETTEQDYIMAYYNVKDETPVILQQSDSKKIYKGDTTAFVIIADNAVSYRWQVKRPVMSAGSIKFKWVDLADRSDACFTYSGTATNRLIIKSDTDFTDTYFRCKIAGKNDTVTYSKTMCFSQIPTGSVSGKIICSGDENDITTLKLRTHSDGGTSAPVTMNILIKSYGFLQLESGHYSLEVSRKNHITRTYYFDIGKSAVNLDVAIAVPCDVNMDGVINIVDATLIQKYIVGLEDFDSYTAEVADTNGDGSISIVDATNIQKKIVNLL